MTTELRAVLRAALRAALVVMVFGSCGDDMLPTGAEGGDGGSAGGNAAGVRAMSGPAVCTVDDDAPADYVTVADALANPACGIIRIGAGTYAEHVVIPRPLLLEGAGADVTTIRGNGASGAVITNDASGVEIRGFTITGGGGGSAGGILSRGHLTVRGSVIRDNRGAIAGGIYNQTAAWGELTVIDSRIEHNQGGAIRGTMTCRGFISGGIASFGSRIEIVGSVIEHNTAGGAGGAIVYEHYSDRPSLIENTRIDRNRNACDDHHHLYTAVIWGLEGDMTVRDSDISGFWWSGLHLPPSQIGIGGITLDHGAVRLENTNVRWVKYAAVAGDVEVVGGRFKWLEGITFPAARAVLDGVFIEDTDSIAFHGVLHTGGSLTMRNSTIRQTRPSAMPAVRLMAGNHVLENNTISGSIGSGVEIGGGTALLRHNTIVHLSGPGVRTSGAGTAVLHGNVIAGNAQDCQGAGLSDAGYNVDGDGSCRKHATSRTGNPTLGALQDNGGPTPTHALLAGSPAIDIVPTAAGCPSRDQRGTQRPQDGNGDGVPACDAGAYEVAGGPGDTTPPEIEAFIIGTPGQNGWYVSEVIVWWAISEPDSPVTAQTGCFPVRVNTDTQGQSVSCSLTSAGGTTTKTVTIRRDTTAPTLSPAVTPSSVLLHGTTLVSAGVADAMSGVATSHCDALVTSLVGTRTITCTATDSAGNGASAQASYTVRYGFEGFVGLAADGVVNVVAAGKSVPFRWRLFDASGAPVTTLRSVKFQESTIACDPAAPRHTAASANGKPGFRNAGGGNYEYNWSMSKNAAGTCRSARIELDDGTTHTLLFEFIR